MEYFNTLPKEIISDILTCVPTESILNCKLVSKKWNYLIHHPKFSKMHLDRLNHPSAVDSGKLGFLAVTDELHDYDELLNIVRIDKVTVMNGKLHYFEYNENDDQSTTPIHIITRIHFPIPFAGTCFVGSCNGLICLSRGPYEDAQTYINVCICNPLTKEYVLLPVIKRDCNIDQYIYWSCGFRDCCFTNEYKVLGLYMCETGSVQVYIYTLGSGSGWRNLGKLDSQFSIIMGKQGIFAIGALYWRGGNLNMILTFDLAEEKFGEHLSPPPLPPDNFWCVNTLGVLDGVLFFAINLVGEGNYCNDIWLLKKKNDMEEPESLGWTNEFRFDERGKLLAVTKSGGILAHVNHLIIYDPKASASKSLVKYKVLFCQAVLHKNTLVSLKELCEEDAAIAESLESGDSDP